MILTLKNIGKIRKAQLDIDGITVIAGANGTGKSTAGRALFAMLNGFCNLPQKIEEERVGSIEGLLDHMYYDRDTRLTSFPDTNAMAKEIVSHRQAYQAVEDAEFEQSILALLHRFAPQEDDFPEGADLHETFSRIKSILRVSDEQLLSSILDRSFYAEFYGQVSNIYDDSQSEATLQIRGKDFTVSWEHGEIAESHKSEDFSLQSEPIYLEDPFVLDSVRSRPLFDLDRRFVNHRALLGRKLFSKAKRENLVDEIITKNKLETIYQRISSVCGGDVISLGHSGLGYRQKNSDKVLDVKNLSTGLKTFAILKTLLLNGVIKQNGTIILDEPEIHLHPEWQLLFAELIVLLQKEFSLHILLNTHSPYFLNAIEVYTRKYHVEDQCKFYFSHLEDDCAVFDDVSGQIETVYQALARPLQTLENESWRLHEAD